MTDEGNVTPEAPAPVPAAAPVGEKPKGLAVAGMILGICGVVLSPPCFLLVVGPIAAVVGIVLSVLGLGKVKAGTASGKNMAMADDLRRGRHRPVGHHGDRRLRQGQGRRSGNAGHHAEDKGGGGEVGTGESRRGD